MTGRTHDLAAFTALGFAAMSLTLPHITLATGITAVFANLIGGIAPDIDQPTAPFWRNLPIGGVVGRGVGKMLGGHRFLSHSVVGIFLFGIGWHFFLQALKPSFPGLDMQIVWFAFMIGFVTHLIMDTFTKEGVPWLLPLPIKIGLPLTKDYRVQTGGFVERFVVFPVLIIVNGYIWYSHYGILLDLLKNHLK
jgi:inner membrane protein